MLMTVGFEMPTEEMMKGWMEWFGSLQDRMVEQVGLRNGKKVTIEGTTELEMDADAITGYVVITAESMDEAEEIAKKCPMITSTLVYEMMSH